MSDWLQEGFRIFSGVFSEEKLQQFRLEADRLATEEGRACVRHIREKSALFDQLACSTDLLSLLPPGLSPVRSILFDKTARENWPVAWHQDLSITVQHKLELPGYGPWSRKDGSVHVQPPVSLLEQMATLRIHLDDTPEENGALRVLPGSHAHGRLSNEAIQAQLQEVEELSCSCRAGDVLLMRPLLLHASRKSLQATRRRIVHVEYAPRDALAAALDWQEAPSESS